MIQEGITYPIVDIPDNERVIRLEHNLKRGNHPVFDETSLNKITEFIKEELEKNTFSQYQ